MSKKTTHNPIPSGTRTLQDILPESQATGKSSGSKTLKKKLVMRDAARYAYKR